MYPPNFLHSHDYYLVLIKTLIRSLNAGFTDRQTSQALNDLAILSPVGRPFTEIGIRQLLKKLRNHRDYPSKIHRALLQLVFDGKLLAPETYILFRQRKQGM